MALLLELGAHRRETICWRGAAMRRPFFCCRRCHMRSKYGKYVCGSQKCGVTVELLGADQDNWAHSAQGRAPALARARGSCKGFESWARLHSLGRGEISRAPDGPGCADGVPATPCQPPCWAERQHLSVAAATSSRECEAGGAFRPWEGRGGPVLPRRTHGGRPCRGGCAEGLLACLGGDESWARGAWAAVWRQRSLWLLGGGGRCLGLGGARGATGRGAGHLCPFGSR